MITTAEKQKLLAQIAIGAAWVDHRLEPSEIEYLKEMLTQRGLIEEQELLTLLQEPVSTFQLEMWLVQYLRHSSELERQKMLATIANLFIADGVVSNQEHEFLDEFYVLMAQIPPQPEDLHPDIVGHLTSAIGKAVKQALAAAKQVIQGDRDSQLENH